MKKIKTILFAGIGSLSLFFNSCKLPIDYENLEFDVPKINYRTNDLEGVLKYVSSNISYMSDKEQYGRDYWADPSETFKSKLGDCDDFAILDMYLLKRDFNIESTFVVGIGKSTYRKHGWLEINGKEYEPQLGREFISSDNYSPLGKLNYAEVMERVLDNPTIYEIIEGVGK